MMAQLDLTPAAGEHGVVHQLLLVVAAGIIVLAPFLAAALDRWSLYGPRERLVVLREGMTIPLGVLSVGAAAIHAAVIGDHFDEDLLFGLFFVAVSVFQFLWALVWLWRPATLVAAVGALVNAAIIVTWFWSRSLGLPFGPHPGDVEAVGINDTLATLFQLVLVLALCALVLPQARRLFDRRSYPAYTLTLAAVLSIICVGLATVFATVSGAAADHVH